MSEHISLSKASFVAILDAVLYPNPDDSGEPGSPWGPYGPIGPIAGAWRDPSWVMLNPQPLPPVSGPLPDPWRRLGWAMLNPQPLPPAPDPQPKYWRAALQARMVIDQAVAQYRSAEMSAGQDASEMSFEAVSLGIRQFVDDYCGTGPRKWPLPWPWPLTSDPVQLDSMALLVAGAQFQKASDAAANSPLQADFAAAANQLIETGLGKMENR